MVYRTRLPIFALLLADLAFVPPVHAQQPEHRAQHPPTVYHGGAGGYHGGGGGDAGAAVMLGILGLGMAAIAASNQPPAYYAPPPVYYPSPSYAPYPGYYPPPPAVYYGAPPY
jgi:hypothetical protein